jgi:Zn finger protein HypA/HybF involved in hydrogenase expression
MTIVQFPRADRQHVVFRCQSCRVRFHPTPTQTDYCPRCSSGRQLYAAVMQYVNVVRSR